MKHGSSFDLEQRMHRARVSDEKQSAGRLLRSGNQNLPAGRWLGRQI